MISWYLSFSDLLHLSVGPSPYAFIFLIASVGRIKEISSIKSLVRVWLCDPMDLSTPGFPVHHQFLELAKIHVHWVGDAIQPSYPLLPPSAPAFNLSQHEYSGLISFRMDWLDLLAAQGTLRSLLQCPSSKATVVLLTPLPSSTHLVLISLCHVLRLCLSFKDFALNPSHLFHFWLRLLS